MVARDLWPLAPDERWWPWPGAPGGAGEVLLREYPSHGSYFVEARARHFEQPIGMVNFGCYEGQQRVEILHLVVEPDWRRMGLGRALAAYVEHWARRRGRRLIHLSVVTEAAGAFWAAVGYERLRRSPVYEKRLQA